MLVKRLIVVTCLALALAACSEKHGPQTAPLTSEATTSTTTVVLGSSGNAAAPATTVPKGGSTATTAPPTTAAPAAAAGSQPPAQGDTPPTSTPLPQGQFPSKASVKKSCVNPGGEQTLSVETVQNAVVTYVMTYSDQRSHKNSNGGLADDKGKYADTFVVAADAPNGTAWVHVSSGTKEKGTSFAEASFTVGC